MQAHLWFLLCAMCYWLLNLRSPMVRECMSVMNTKQLMAQHLLYSVLPKSRPLTVRKELR